MRRDGAANRERILAMAEEVFGSGGVSASTEEVARRAGVGVATVFRHFPTKQLLIEATAVRYLELLEREAREQVGAPDAHDAFTALIRSLISAGATKLALLNRLNSEGQGVTEPILAASQRWHEAVREVLEAAQKAGRVRPDLTVDDVFVLTTALAQLGDSETREAIDRAADVILDGMALRN